MKAFWFGFLFGLICGIFSTKYYLYSEKTKEISVKSATIDDIIKKNKNNIVIKTQIVETTFNDSGKVLQKTEKKTEKKIEKISERTDLIQTKYNLDVNQLSITKNQNSPSLVVGSSYSFSDFQSINLKDYENVNLIAGYRLVSNLVIFGQANLEFNKFAIGILIFF